MGRGHKKLEDAGTPPPWDGGMAEPLEICFPHLCYHVKFSNSRSNHLNIIMQISQKIMTSHPTFQGHLVIGTDTYRSATYEFLLVFHL